MTNPPPEFAPGFPDSISEPEFDAHLSLRRTLEVQRHVADALVELIGMMQRMSLGGFPINPQMQYYAIQEQAMKYTSLQVEHTIMVYEHRRKVGSIK